MTQIVTLSVPRTGSTHLGGHLRAFSGLHVFGEVFHPANSHGLNSDHLDHLRDRFDATVSSDLSDPATIDWVRSHPVEMFEMFDHFAGDRAAVVKLFPQHLDREFVTTSLLPRSDVVSLVLYRRVIDSYASAAKARQASKWRSVDTTDLRAQARIHHFRGWARLQQEWYSDCRAAIEGAGRPYNVFRYEEHLDVDSEELLGTIEQFLLTHDIDPGERSPVERTTMKQDTTPDYRQKFSDWDAFSDELEKEGLLELATGYFT